MVAITLIMLRDINRMFIDAILQDVNFAQTWSRYASKLLGPASRDENLMQTWNKNYPSKATSPVSWVNPLSYKHPQKSYYYYFKHSAV